MDIDLDVIPWRTQSMFLRRDFMVSSKVTVSIHVILEISHSNHSPFEWCMYLKMANMNTWAMSKVGPHNFAAKWFVGRARPEEVVWAIKTGRLVDGVPLDIRRAVQWLPIRSAREFTAYPEGSPR